MDFSYLTDNEKQAFLRLMEEKQVISLISFFLSFFFFMKQKFLMNGNDYPNSDSLLLFSLKKG